MGMRIKVCSAFQTRSKAGILSAKNSMAKSAPLAAITYQLATRCKAGGKDSTPKWASSPRVATVAYTFSPAAKLTATSRATSSSPVNFIPSGYLPLARKPIGYAFEWFPAGTKSRVHEVLRFAQDDNELLMTIN